MALADYLANLHQPPDSDLGADPRLLNPEALHAAAATRSRQALTTSVERPSLVPLTPASDWR